MNEVYADYKVSIYGVRRIEAMPSEELMRKMRQIQNRVDNSKGGKFHKLNDGDNNLRFLPSWRGDDEEWALFVPTHYGLGPSKKRFVTCQEHFGKKCYICFTMQKLSNTGIAADNQTAYDIRVQPRVLLNALPDNDPQQAIKIISLSGAAYTELLSVYQTDGDFMDPVNGFIVNMRRAKIGNKLYPEYKAKAARENCEISRPNWAQELINIDQEVQQYNKPWQELAAILRGEDTDDGR